MDHATEKPKTIDLGSFEFVLRGGTPDNHLHLYAKDQRAKKAVK